MASAESRSSPLIPLELRYNSAGIPTPCMCRLFLRTTRHSSRFTPPSVTHRRPIGDLPHRDSRHHSTDHRRDELVTASRDNFVITPRVTSCFTLLHTPHHPTS